MPQTIEAMNHAKAAKVQILVAITKWMRQARISTRSKDSSRKRVGARRLGRRHHLLSRFCDQGHGVEQLLESILLVAEVTELKASSRVAARGR